MKTGDKTSRWEILEDRIPESKDEILEIILKNRKLNDSKIFESNKYIEPSPSDVGIDIKSFEKAINRIKKSITKNEQIIIFGDYDADGICATTILWESLYRHSKKVMPYIPHRSDEGYGISQKAIKNLQKKYPDTKLIITVDNGIVAHDAVDCALEKGIDIIITDHHTKGESYPKAYSIVYTTQLSGAGVAWMLAKEFTDDPEKLLELVAIASVADLVPLIGWNRILVKKGLEELNNTSRIGLKQILTEAKITGRNIGVFDIGFIIAPRLNASGRMDHAIESLRLLCTQNNNYARLKAAIISKHNRSRQQLTESLTMLAKEIYSKSPHPKIAILSHEKFDEGVIGLIASKMVEEYYTPAVVMTISGDKIKGSARSVNGVNIVELIQSHSNLLDGVGGHPMAAGFNLKKSNLKSFVNALTKSAEKRITKDLLTKTIKADTYLPLSLATEELFSSINSLYPFGIGNPEPTFVSDNLTISSLQKVGKTKDHLKLDLSNSHKSIEGIAFGFGNTKLKKGKIVDVLASLSINEWNNKKTLTLRVKDIKEASR